MFKEIFLSKFLLTLGVILFSPDGYAVTSCSANASLYTFPGASFTVQRDTPLNSPISQVIYSTPNTFFAYGCNTIYNEWVNIGIATSLPFHSVIENKKVYSTSIPGVGIAIGARANRTAATSTTFFISGNNNLFGDNNGIAVRGFNEATGSYLRIYAQPAIQFYKIGPISSNTFSGNIAEFRVGTNSQLSTGIPVSLGTIRVNSVACSINNSAIQVPLPDVNVNDFTAINKTLSPKGFSLNLNCDANARINVKMVGEKNTDTSADGVLQLTDAGSLATATGVGIQILYNSRPLVLDNNILLKASAGGQETFPFTAQYYQTKSKVTGGLANSTMVLDVTYQ
ncbi:conserved exported hypothetical protein [Enterobacterales bacterium 8AC]|nr:conserved exported hypothetical protein [Enterobacterales bacterium 8AC]